MVTIDKKDYVVLLTGCSGLIHGVYKSQVKHVAYARAVRDAGKLGLVSYKVEVWEFSTGNGKRVEYGLHTVTT